LAKRSSARPYRKKGATADLYLRADAKLAVSAMLAKLQSGGAAAYVKASPVISPALCPLIEVNRPLLLRCGNRRF
jgi:hypothetical protein